MGIFNFLDFLTNDKKKKQAVDAVGKATKDTGGAIFNFLKNTGKTVGDVANATGNAVGQTLNQNGEFLGAADIFPGVKEGRQAVIKPDATMGDFLTAIASTGVQNHPLIGGGDRTLARLGATITGKPQNTLFGTGSNATLAPIQEEIGNAQGPANKALAALAIGGDAVGVGGELKPLAKAASPVLTDFNKSLGESGYIGGSKAKSFPEAQKAGAVTKGVDNKPKFEADDSQAKFNLTAGRKPGATLSDVVDHPTLFEDYPELANVKISFDSSMKPKELGGYNPESKTITLNPGVTRSKLENTILHETQHAIQSIEGHATGGSPTSAAKFADSLTSPFDAYRALAGEAEARNVANRQNLTMDRRQQVPFNSTFDVAPDKQIVNFSNPEAAAMDALQSPQAPVETPQVSAVDKLTSALGEAKPAQKNIAKAQSQALASRGQAIQEILANNPGEKGFAMAKKALQGPLVKDAPTIKQKLDQNDLNDLFGQIQNHATLRPFEKIRAYDALNKVFDGTVPQKNEIGLLEDVFGSKLAKTVVDVTKTKGQKVREAITSVANVPRAIMSSFDFSAPFRQGLVLTVNHPVSAAKAGSYMFKSAFSPSTYKGWLDEVKTSENYGRMKDSGLYLADSKGAAGALSDKEEAFMSNLAEKIPLIGHIVKAGERAYNGYLNKIRVDTFNNLADRYAATGQGDAENLKSLAKFINTATGRGNLGKLEKIAPELNAVFFAPRNMASRLNMLNPKWYVGLKGPARKEAIKSAGVVLATGLTTLGIAKAAGAEVNDDPRSTDFGKIKIGNSRYDIWGGFQQYARAATQLLTGQKNVQGDVVKADRLNTATKFVRSKLAPIPASVTDIAEGVDYVGQPVTPEGLAIKNLLPFGVQDAVKGEGDIGPAGAASSLPSVFGIGYQNYTPQSKKKSTKSKKKNRSKERY
jgi:hypothetical protein